MVRLIDPQFRLAQQQQRLQERRLQLENDPGRIFLRSLAQSVPQELIRGGVQIGRDALGYKVFGGERKQMADEAYKFRAARKPFFEKFYKDEYDKIMAAQKPGGVPGQVPSPGRQQPPAKAAPKPKKQKRITLPDGRVAVEAKEGELAGTFYKGKRYNIVAPETLRQEKISGAPKTRALGDGRVAVKVDIDFSEDDSSPEELQKKLAKQGLVLVDGVAYRVLNQEQSARYVAEERKRQLDDVSMPPAPNIPPPVYRSPFDTTDEHQKAMALEQADYETRVEGERKSREKEYGEQQKTKRKRLDKVQDMLKTQVTKAFEYIGVSGVEDLRKTQDNFLNAMAASDDVDEIDLYLNALMALPSENQIITATGMVKSKGGTKVGQTDSRKRTTNIRMPTTRSFQSAAERAQIVVNKLRKKLAAAGPGTPRHTAISRSLQKAVTMRDNIILASKTNQSSTGPVITDENQDVLVSKPTAENYGGIGTAPGAEGVKETLMAGQRDAQPILIAINQRKKEGKLKPEVSKAYKAYMDNRGEEKASKNLAAFLDEDGNVREEFIQDPEETFEQTYPNLAASKESFKGSTLLKKPSILAEMNSQLKGKGIDPAQMPNLINAVITEDVNRFQGATDEFVVKQAMIEQGLIK